MSETSVENEKILFKSSGLASPINVPGDKSITHRAIMFGSIANGVSKIRTNILGRDNFATIRIFQQLGVQMELRLNMKMEELALNEGIKNISPSGSENCEITVHGKGLGGLIETSDSLDCGNSGTTARLLTGLFSALNFPVLLVGDESLSKRPFARVTEPLKKMGAGFSSDNLPITIKGGSLKGINWDSSKASAQVKSALMLAGLYAEGTTLIREPFKSRDHTEKMLEAMGAKIECSENEQGWIVTSIESLSETPGSSLKPLDIAIPGDISAAMFFIVCGLLDPNGKETLIRNVGVNPTRSGCLAILKKMGAKIELVNSRTENGETVSDILVKKSNLQAITIDKREVAFAVDEIPIISVAASFAEGETVITGAEELRVKESDRISKTVELLSSYNVSIVELEDGMKIMGDPNRKGTLVSGDQSWKVCGDHRISMCGAIIEYLLKLDVEIRDLKSIETSFPSFLDAFQINTE